MYLGRMVVASGDVFPRENRQRFIATQTVGYSPAGKRIVRKGSGRSGS
jgi:hypothetical protein